MIFHRHHWEEVRRVFNSPDRDMEGLKGRGPEAYRLARQLIFGITNVEERCQGCGKINFTQVIGDARKPLPTFPAGGTAWPRARTRRDPDA